MPITLRNDKLEQASEDAFFLATGDDALPETWVVRMERLDASPSVAFIAAVGAVLLAKATDSRIDAFVIQAKEGSAGAYSLRRAATALARNHRLYGYDIASTSDRDPINHGTLVSSTRWDIALDRITPRHKPFFQVVLRWLSDINRMTQEEATLALAAFIRARREVAPGAAVDLVPPLLASAPSLADLVDVLEGFVSADAEHGARGMALVAAVYRAAGFEADVPSRNDPRRVDISIKRDGKLIIASEVKQLDTGEATAYTLAEDAVAHGTRRALLVVLRPGTLVAFDRSSVIRRAEREHGVVLRITDGSRELLHEALAASDRPVEELCAALPRAFAEALRDIRVAEDTIEAWAAIAQRWTGAT